MLCSIGVRAGEPTTDYVYATGLKYNSSNRMYFDVVLKSDALYCGYGLDIHTPNGLSIVKKSNGIPDITRLTTIWPYTEEYDEEEDVTTKIYTHTLIPSFPNGDVHFARVACYSGNNDYFTKKEGNMFRVYVESNYTEGSWPIGAIKFSNVELDQVGHPYDAANTETAVPVHTGETTLPLKVSSAAKWSTCILPFAASIPEGVKAYTCSHSDEEYIYLENAESFAAYTPYILYAENGFDGNVSGTVEATIPDNAKTGVVANGYLNGAIVPQTATEGYVLQNHDGAVKFYAITDGDSFAIPAGKCWMNIPASESRALTFRTDNVTGGINNITLPTTSLPYDLNGRQQTVKKGVLIKNGQKTLSL